MRWVFQNSGSDANTGWKTFTRHSAGLERPDRGKKEDLEFGPTIFSVSNISTHQKLKENKNNFRKKPSNKLVAMQQVSESVQKVAREVAVIRSEVKKVRGKVDGIVIPICVPMQSDPTFGKGCIEKGISSQMCQVHNKSSLPSQLHDQQNQTTEDEADSIRSQTSSNSQSKTGSLRSDDVELDVDSGLELGGTFERPFHQSKERDKILVEDRWRKLFDKYDPEGFGEIPWPDFFVVLNSSSEFREEVPPGKRQILQDLGMIYSQHSTAINAQLFVNIMSGKRSRSFKCAVHHRDREVLSENDFHIFTSSPPSHLTRMARLIADEFLTEERDRKYYADHYRCLPPPIFIIFVTLIQIGIFITYAISSSDTPSPNSPSFNDNSPLPLLMDFPFVYRPDKQDEIWRFLAYMFVHASWVHLLFNLLVQLLVGLPLEMVHGSFRTAAIYMAGVLAGSLATSVFDKDVYLVGGSGGVYALLASHLANVLLNYNNMDFGVLRLLGIFLIASVDVGLAVYHRYSSVSFSVTRDLPHSPVSVSYVAHLAGALAGLTIGIVVLKNFEQRLREQCMWWAALALYGTCTLFAIIFNLLRPFEPMSTEFIQISEPFPHPMNW